LAQALQGPLAALFLRTGRQGWGWRRGLERSWPQAHAADLEVLLEAVELEEVGEFEGADIAAPLADLALEVSDDSAQVLQGKAGPQKFTPHPFAVVGKCQAQGLAGQLAIELMSLADRQGIDPEGRGRGSGHSLGSGSGLSGWGRQQPSRSGDSFDGGLDVRWLDGLSAGAGSFDPGRAAQQAQTVCSQWENLALSSSRLLAAWPGRRKPASKSCWMVKMTRSAFPFDQAW